MTTPTLDTSASAKQHLEAFLQQYGLGALGDWAWNEHLKGASDDQILLDMRSTPEYQARFPAMQALAKQGRAMTEGQYMAIEDSYRQVLHSYGLPAGFYDQPTDFAKWLTGDVSPSELNDRVKQYTSIVMGDTETLHQLQTLYGDVGHDGNPQGDLLAHYLDPTRAAPLLTEHFAAAQFASAAARSGFGQLSAAQAEQFGARTGTSEQQAEQGFGALVTNRELMGGLPGEQQNDISQDTQLGAAFGGDALAQQQIEQRRRLRVAEGAGGGGFAGTSKGLTGLSSNDT